MPLDDGTPDRELIELILGGQHVQEAWDALMARYANLIYTVPLRYGLQESDARDVYQMVCETMWGELVHLRDRDRLASWLLTVAGRLSWRAVTTRRRQRQRESIVLHEQSPVAAPDPSPDDIVLRREEWRAVAAAIRVLSARCQTLIWYLYYDPSMPSYEEIAARMDLAIGSIGPIRARCLSSLKKKLGDLET